MENKRDRIVEEIRESLINYELPYEEGAWERFREKQYNAELVPVRKIKDVPFIPIGRIMTVAASLIFIISIVSVFRAYYSDSQSRVAKVIKIDSVNLEREKRQELVLSRGQDERTNEQVKPNSIVRTRENQIVNAKINNDLKVEEKNINIVSLPEPKEPVQEDKKQVILTENRKPSSDIKDVKSLNPFENIDEVLLSENLKINRAIDDDNWKFGIELSSSFISDKMNYGGGVFAERKLSDKISLTSGVAFTKINAANEIGPVGISSSTRKVGVEASMQALDIPLSIVYQVNDGFYASMGVSLLTVLDGNKSYQYETDVVSTSLVKDPKTGVESTVYSTVTRQYTEPVQELDSKGNDNIGYLNLSIGRKQNFYGKTKLLLEPFLKLPISKLSDEEVKLMNAGLKIKVMF
ncbi:hypothetical protein [Albibacterium sp.]|uniref:hypothetical protein n=1 Tax=Albibacterium sp. TaxID=2952885 RepID=UPI002C11F557|nr:hypothetical protein [Albibacterium sp.]HUH18288.1 hypothetical protein [Albibacterium sp.]